MKKKFAFLLMGKEFDTAKDTAVFETEHMISYISVSYTHLTLPTKA